MKETNEVLGGIGAQGPDCLSAAQLEALLDGKATEAVGKHASTCSHCQTELALIKQFVEAEPTAEEAVAVRQIEKQLRAAPAWRPVPEAKPKRGRFTGWLSTPIAGLAAAGAVALLVAGLWFTSPSRLGEQPADSGLTRAMGVEGIEPLGDLERAPSRLSWRAVPGAAAYDVSLLDIEEKTVWTAKRQSATELPLPASASNLMTNRKTLFWQIAAYDAKGKLMVSSGPQRFRVVPPTAAL